MAELDVNNMIEKFKEFSLKYETVESISSISELLNLVGDDIEDFVVMIYIGGVLTPFKFLNENKIKQVLEDYSKVSHKGILDLSIHHYDIEEIREYFLRIKKVFV